MIHSYEATLLHKTTLTDTIVLLSFSFPEEPTWTFQAGQYMIFMIPHGEHPARRLYSIASPPSQKKTLDFVIELVPNGIGSMYIKDMKVGDKLTLQGPAGIFTYKPSDRAPVFLATGTGIAPIYSMIHTALNSTFEIRLSNFFLFWGLKNQSDIYLFDELKKLATNHKHFHLSICLSREETIDREYCMCGRVTKGLEDLTTHPQNPISNFDYYLCGSKLVVESLREYLTEKGVAKEQVHFEKFT